MIKSGHKFTVTAPRPLLHASTQLKIQQSKQLPVRNVVAVAAAHSIVAVFIVQIIIVSELN